MVFEFYYDIPTHTWIWYWVRKENKISNSSFVFKSSLNDRKYCHWTLFDRLGCLLLLLTAYAFIPIKKIQSQREQKQSYELKWQKKEAKENELATLNDTYILLSVIAIGKRHTQRYHSVKGPKL